MLEDVMNKAMFDEFVLERMDIAERSNEFVNEELKKLCEIVEAIKEQILDYGIFTGRFYYLAGLRDGQLIQKGGLPRKESSASATPQS